MNQTLVIVRHAHRIKALGRERDNGLSVKGRKQAKRIGAFFTKRFSHALPVLYSSPKLRCVETIEPIGKKSGAKVHPLDCLDEGGNLAKKIREFQKELGSVKRPVIVFCSHGDWIPEFFHRVLGVSIDLDKGGWAELEKLGSEWRLRWLVQDLS